MSKMMTWMGIMSGITLLCYFFGMIPETPSGTLLNLALNPQNLQTTPFWLKLISVGGVAIAGAAISSRFFNISGDQVLMWPILLVLSGFGWDFLVVYQQMSASGGPIAGVVAVLLFGPIMMMYIISVIEWWRGVAP